MLIVPGAAQCILTTSIQEKRIVTDPETKLGFKTRYIEVVFFAGRADV